uniref:Zinc finger, CCHC-type n=1 Tax=Tanacetum cinerariifolium TaxID=118510 RepID=A0A6L2NAR8_TANCI|nr:zinc finger, CCHC-type [Tanacetum cinerariifolium]
MSLKVLKTPHVMKMYDVWGDKLGAAKGRKVNKWVVWILVEEQKASILVAILLALVYQTCSHVSSNLHVLVYLYAWNALISLSDKKNLDLLVAGLQELWYTIVSTEGTASSLEKAGIFITKVKKLTNFPTMLDGHVKTLHLNVYGGILTRRDQSHHMEALEKHNIGTFELVFVNIYPFYAKVSSASGVSFDDGIENINIGLGETLEDKVLVRKLLNSAPKKFLPIVATIEQYQDLDEMSFEEAVGRLTAYEERIKSQDTLEANDQDKLLMASSNNKSYGKWRGKDFNQEAKESMKWKNNPNARRTSTSQGTKDKIKLKCYECESWHEKLSNIVLLTILQFLNGCGSTEGDKFLPSFIVPFTLKSSLRYGENPHQKAAFYTDISLSEVNGGGITKAIQHQGKEMSYNNYFDADAAWNCVCEFKEPTCTVVKHTNPCGNNCMLGMESGQQNHVESLRIDVRKARDEVKGAALATWNNAVEEACQSRIGVITKPGGIADELQRVYSLVSRNSRLKDIHQSDGFSVAEEDALLAFQHECVYVLTTPMPEDGGDNPTVEQVMKRAKWDNDNYVCRGLILNEAKYMAEDASSKKFLVSNFINYKMSDSKPVLEQYNELIGILGRFTQHKMNMDESIQVQYNRGKRKHHDTKADPNKKPKVTCWKCGKPGHLKKDCNAGNVGNKANGSGTKGSVDGSFNLLKGQNMFNKSLQVCYVTYVSEAYFVQDDDVACDLCDLHATLSLGNKKYFVTFIDDTSRFCYVYLLHSKDEALDKFKVFKTEVELQQRSMIKRFRTDKGVAINSIIESRDAIFDKNRLSSVSRPSQRSLVNETKDIGGSVVPKKVTDKVVQQPEPELRKRKRHRTPKDFGLKLQLYLIEGTRDEVSDQHSYCFNVEDSLKTFDEEMKSQDVAFRKEVINDEIDSIMGINTWVLADLPPGCEPLGCKWIFKRKLKVDGTVEKFKERLVIQGFKQKSRKDYFDTYALMDVKTTFLNGELDEEVDLTKKFLSSRFSMKDIGEADVILGIRIAISQSYYIEKVVSQLEYSRVIVCLMYAMTCTRPDIVFVVGKPSRLMYTGYPSVLEGYTDVSWISNTEDNLSTSSRVFLLGGGAISWASKKQTSITSSTMEFEFVALAAAAPIFIRCDSAATLEKAYSQMYNGKSRHLGVRHSMIRELITNGVVSIEFVRSQQNLADHLTKRLARDVVIKSAEGIGLKGLKHMYLQIILEMCLESAEKEDEVVNFLMVNFFKKVLDMRMNKEEPPM